MTTSGKATTDAFTKEDIFKHNLNNDFVRSAQLLRFKEKLTGEIFVIVNTHFGLANDHKLLAAAKLCEYVSKINEPLYLMGDFNQFERGKINILYDAQIKIFQDHGFTWDSKCLETMNPGGTFLPFPHDIRYMIKDLVTLEKFDNLMKAFVANVDGKEKIELQNLVRKIIRNLGKDGISYLDVSYDATISKNGYAECKALFFKNGERVKPCPSREQINTEIANTDFTNKISTEPSDHLPILATLDNTKMSKR